MGLIFSVSLALVFWSILINPYRYFIPFCIATIFFSLYRYLIYKEKLVSFNFTFFKNEVVFPCLVFFSLISLFLIQPISEVHYISWIDIPLVNFLRLFMSLFITLFAPGYMLLNIMDRQEKLSKTMKLLFSVLISLLILPFIGVISFTFGSNLQDFGTILIVILNLILLFPYILTKRVFSQNNKLLSFNLNELLVFFSILLFMFVLLLIKFSSNITWSYGDLDIHYGYSVSFTKTTFPLSIIGPGVNYPYWVHIFTAQFLIASGIPYVNAFQFLSVPLSFLPIFSSYLLFSAFFNKLRHRKIPIIATALCFFSGGFGWIISNDLLSNSQSPQGLFQLYSIFANTGSGYLIPSVYSVGIYPFYIFALTCVFTLIWLIFSERGSQLGKLRYFLIPVLITLGYLSHLAEIVLFVFIFFVSLLIIKRKASSTYRKCAISILLRFNSDFLARYVCGWVLFYCGGASVKSFWFKFIYY